MYSQIKHLARRGIGESDPKHADFLLNLVSLLPPNPVVVEVGTFKGGTAREFALVRPDATVYCVDIHKHADWDANILEANVQDRVKFIQGISWESAHLVPMADMVYIDADHDYNSVLKDIIAWTPKVKYDGILAGDDYDLFEHDNWRAHPEMAVAGDRFNSRSGKNVCDAVNEAVPGVKIWERRTWYKIIR